MRYKDGVNLNGVQPPTWYAIGVADQLYLDLHKAMVVTSLTDGVHPDGKNIHGRGFAVDIRTRDLAPGELGDIAERLKWKLYALGYDIVIENDHLHVEYDPKPGRNEWAIKET